MFTGRAPGRNDKILAAVGRNHPEAAASSDTSRPRRSQRRGGASSFIPSLASYHAPTGQGCACIYRREIGLKSNSNTETLSKFT
jgi:hypothetical protein